MGYRLGQLRKYQYPQREMSSVGCPLRSFERVWARLELLKAACYHYFFGDGFLWVHHRPFGRPGIA
tara:strand:- start:48 stop:245 length:198 start_codon:yes stop_codon:yes gene_type:complete